MPRPIWKGQISFGLVNIPITVQPAERRHDLNFNQLDRQNSARIRYQKINAETEQEVPLDRIVKGYEYEAGQYVLLSEEDLDSAAPEMTRTIEIVQFVDQAEIDAVYFDKPYYVVPEKAGVKGYVLLREALQQSGKVGLAQVVIRSRQSLSALTVMGEILVLSLLRYQDEVIAPAEYDVPGADLKQHKVNPKEVDLAKQLIDGMTSPWEPSQFHNEFRAALLKLIERKIASGKTQVVRSEPAAQRATPTINMMDVLKQSLNRTTRPKTPRRQRRAVKRTKAG